MAVTARRQGFTLVELMIALVVLSVGLAGMIPVLVQSVRGNTFGRNTTLTATYSQDKLEELRRAQFAALLAQCNVGGSDTPTPGIARSWRIAPGDGGACAGARVLVIEACTTDTGRYDCFPGGGSTQPAPASHYLLAVRADY
ncbi:MAG: type IV pilus modification PilV family protein [Deferrisomatales bacterium]